MTSRSNTTRVDSVGLPKLSFGSCLDWWDLFFMQN
jgi:hypothetical protein